MTYAAYRRHTKNSGVTEFVELPGRGHSLVIDNGWGQVARTALDFVHKYA
jgi:dipeptidyl aminopeptidase/acylaminoacyl peptidase